MLKAAGCKSQVDCRPNRKEGERVDGRTFLGTDAESQLEGTRGSLSAGSRCAFAHTLRGGPRARHAHGDGRRRTLSRLLEEPRYRRDIATTAAACRTIGVASTH